MFIGFLKPGKRIEYSQYSKCKICISNLYLFELFSEKFKGVARICIFVHLLAIIFDSSCARRIFQLLDKLFLCDFTFNVRQLCSCLYETVLLHINDLMKMVFRDRSLFMTRVVAEEKMFQSQILLPNPP